MNTKPIGAGQDAVAGEVAPVEVFTPEDVMRARYGTVMLVGLCIGLAGCTGDNLPTGAHPAPATAAFERAFARTEDALKGALEAEKARLKLEAERSKPVYDSLKVVWDAYLHDRGAGTSESRLLTCDPLAYDADTKIIGPEGGDISIGPHKLSIPKGALKEYVLITGEMPVSLLVSVKLSPHGLRFKKSPELMLSYKHCDRSPQFEERVVYLDDLNRIVEWPKSKDSAAGEVFARISHFSRYAVAW